MKVWTGAIALAGMLASGGAFADGDFVMVCQRAAEVAGNNTTSSWLAEATLVVTIVIGLITAFIAYSQMRIASAKVKLDLYNKRFNVYLVTLDYYQSIDSNDVGSMQRKYEEFVKCCRESQFLFDKSDGVSNTLEKLMKNGGDILSYDRNKIGANAEAKLMLDGGRDDARQAFMKGVILLEVQIAKYISFKTVSGWH